MEQSELDRVGDQFARDVRERLPGAPVQETRILRYGDDPEVEPGQLLARISLEASGGREERAQVLEDFHRAHRSAVQELREDLDKLSPASVLEFVVAAGEGEDRGPAMKLKLAGRRGAPEATASLTPVMARLGPVELETVDTLITAGIASNRAEAVRWALARIRERPAYAELKERTRQIDELKSQL